MISYSCSPSQRLELMQIDKASGLTAGELRDVLKKVNPGRFIVIGSVGRKLAYLYLNGEIDKHPEKLDIPPNSDPARRGKVDFDLANIGKPISRSEAKKLS